MYENDDFDKELIEKAKRPLTVTKFGSGGKTNEQFDVLYISEEMAKDALKKQLLDTLIPGEPWCWDKAPIIERFQMTECKAREMSQRVTANRYAGHCSILRVEVDNVD